MKMSWREGKQFVGTLVVAAILLAVPAGAATRRHETFKAGPGGLLSQVVAWLQNLTAPLWLDKKDEGSTIDPNRIRTKSGSTIDPDGAKIDEGSSIDPNGVK
jgi:hypothetical protein